jgi:hypothetical protein
MVRLQVLLRVLADDSSRQLGVCGEVQYERAVGW